VSKVHIFIGNESFVVLAFPPYYLHVYREREMPESRPREFFWPEDLDVEEAAQEVARKVHYNL